MLMTDSLTSLISDKLVIAKVSGPETPLPQQTGQVYIQIYTEAQNAAVSETTGV